MPNKAMERKGLSKSAPASRRTNSTKQDKTSTVNEINKWIHKGNNDQFARTCSRGVSTLTENVTEERMLYSRQLELGRERYKFLANHEYQKQKFVERQQIKDKMMKQFMASARKVIEKTYSEKPKKTLTIRIPQMEESSDRNSPVVEEQPSRSESRVSRASSKVGKKTSSKDVHRLPSAASRDGRGFSKYSSRTFHTSSTEKGPGNNHGLNSASKRHERNDTSIVKQKCTETETNRTGGINRGVYFNTSDTAIKDCKSSETKADSRLPSVLRSVSIDNRRSATDRKSIVPERSRSTSPSKSVRYSGIPVDPRKSVVGSEPTTPKWTKSPRGFGKFGEKFDTSVSDPRYVALTNTLMTVGDIKMPEIGVKEIIENNEVFKCVSKAEDAAHAKQMHAKFIALLLENEFK